ncbi:MAG: hypothetical protein LBM27_02220 [Lactobacillaceae bacterium]|jgi:hypothetical protein|nr:hypothetical protein [Lactobacillaceae bacterium]
MFFKKKNHLSEWLEEDVEEDKQELKSLDEEYYSFSKTYDYDEESMEGRSLRLTGTSTFTRELKWDFDLERYVIDGSDLIQNTGPFSEDFESPSLENDRQFDEDFQRFLFENGFTQEDVDYLV